MKRQKPLNQDLGSMITELSLNIQNYPETDKKTILKLTKELDDKLVYGQKQQTKDNLLEKIGYSNRDSKIHSSLHTIHKNIIYLIDIGIKKEDISKVVTRHPQVLSIDVQNTIKARVEYLKSICVKEIGKVVTRLPQVLGLDIEKTMKPKIEYFKSVGIKEENIGKVITKLPAILDLDIERTIKPRVEYLLSIGVKKENIGKVVTRSPQVLEYDIERTMKPKVEYLKSIGIKDEDVEIVITKHPAILDLDIEKNLKPTYEYLQSKFDVGVDNIIVNPALFSYSLKNRIKPRYEFLKLKGLLNRYKVNSILLPSDEKFCKWFDKFNEYPEFKKNYFRKLDKL